MHEHCFHRINQIARDSHRRKCVPLPTVVKKSFALKGHANARPKFKLEYMLTGKSLASENTIKTN